MAVTTWSFGSGFDGWTFIDNSAEVFPGKNACPTCSATRSHVSGAIRTTHVVDSLPNVCSWGLHFSPIGLNAAIVNLDTIEVDNSATSDSPNNIGINIIAVYTDTTEEETGFISFNSASTQTLTLTQSKTLDYIRIDFARCTSGSASGTTHFQDMLEVRLITATVLTPTSGKLRTPFAFIEDEGAGAAGGAGGGADNVASISADGANVYIASFNNLGFPTLIKISAFLIADGSVVFEPGAGGRIGVQCGELNNDVVYVAGLFDSTNTVEKSEDAGSSFSVIDDSTFGTIRSFAVGPNNDNRIIVFDGDNGDIIESLDGGETWTTINSSVTQLINSIARFDVNPEEIVVGNEGDATDSINYSPNSGANLEDFQTGVYPNADATKVVAN